MNDEALMELNRQIVLVLETTGKMQRAARRAVLAGLLFALLTGLVLVLEVFKLTRVCS